MYFFIGLIILSFFIIFIFRYYFIKRFSSKSYIYVIERNGKFDRIIDFKHPYINPLIDKIKIFNWTDLNTNITHIKKTLSSKDYIYKFSEKEIFYQDKLINFDILVSFSIIDFQNVVYQYKDFPIELKRTVKTCFLNFIKKEIILKCNYINVREIANQFQEYVGQNRRLKEIKINYFSITNLNIKKEIYDENNEIIKFLRSVS